MADPVVPPAGGTTPPATPKRPHGDIAKEILDQVALAKKVLAAASVSVRATALEARQVTAADRTAFGTKITEAEDTLMPDVVTKKHDAKLRTAEERAAKKIMLTALGVIHKGVKRTYPGDKAKFDVYLINKLRDDREGLTADVESIVTRAKADTLKGVTVADCDAVTAALGPWRAADTAQTEANDKYSTAVQVLRDAVDKINVARRDIQMAADLVYPHTNATYSADRQAFGIPEKQPFVASNVKPATV